MLPSVVLMRSWLHLGMLAISACGRKEAADPRDVLGQDMNYGGVDGRSGEVRPSSASGASDEGNEAADADHCREGAEHLVELGIELAIQEETDPNAKAKLMNEREQALTSEQARTLASEWTKECLERGDTVAEVDCILKASRQSELERCAPGE